MADLDVLAPQLHTISEAADRVGVPVAILVDLADEVPPTWVLYRGRRRYPLLTPEDIEAATGVRCR